MQHPLNCNWFIGFVVLTELLRLFAQEKCAQSLIAVFESRRHDRRKTSWATATLNQRQHFDISHIYRSIANRTISSPRLLPASVSRRTRLVSPVFWLCSSHLTWDRLARQTDTRKCEIIRTTPTANSAAHFPRASIDQCWFLARTSSKVTRLVSIALAPCFKEARGAAWHVDECATESNSSSLHCRLLYPSWKNSMH